MKERTLFIELEVVTDMYIRELKHTNLWWTVPTVKKQKSKFDVKKIRVKIKNV